jgi:transposase-like protein
MPLPNALNDTLVSFACPDCGYRFEKTGMWFKSVSRFRCEGCGRHVHLTYSDKVKLFEQHEANWTKTSDRGSAG